MLGSPRCFITDTASAKAPLATFGGKNPTDRAKNGIKKSIVIDWNRIILSVLIDKANKHDPLHDNLKIEISKKILNQCRGTDAFIITDPYNCESIYRSISVNKRELPPPIYAPYSLIYNRNLVVDWNLRKSIFEHDREQIEIQQLYKLTPEKIRILDIVKKFKSFADAHTPQLAYQAFMLPAEENSQLEEPNSRHIPKENYLKKSCLIS